jgi:hypothetical protein
LQKNQERLGLVLLQMDLTHFQKIT